MNFSQNTQLFLLGESASTVSDSFVHLLTKDADIKEDPVFDFNCRLRTTRLHALPRKGSKTPWRLHQNYVKDLSLMRYGRVEDGTMEFTRRTY